MKPSILESNKFKVSLIIIAAVLALILIVLIGVFADAFSSHLGQENKNVSGLGNMHILGEASMIYSADSDGQLPPASIWMDSLTPFTPVKSNPFQSAALAASGDSKLKPNHPIYGTAFLKTLGEIKTASIPNPSSQILIFESTLTQRNAASELDTIPRLGRYKVQGKYVNPIAYADGHAAWK